MGLTSRLSLNTVRCHMHMVAVLPIIALSSPLFAQAHAAPPADFSAIRKQLLDHVGGDDVPGMAVAVSQNGRIIWEEGFGWADRERQVPAGADTPFYIASVTKPITATAILHLAENRKLQLDAPVNEYLGAVKVHSPEWDASLASVRRLLSHTSGLTTFSRWCRSAAEPACDIEQEIEHYGVLVWAPGEVFDYSNLGFGILGNVVARASDESLDSYLQSAIFQPLKMHDCAIELRGAAANSAAAQYDQKTRSRSPARVSGHEGASGLHCSAHDLLLFGMFQLKEHLAPGSPLTTEDIDMMHGPQPATQGQYGLGWWLREQGGIKIVSAEGGTSTAYALLELIPAKDIAIVVVANSYSQRVSDLKHQIVSVLAPELPSETASSTVALKLPVPRELAGQWRGTILTYKGPINVALDVGRDGGAVARFGKTRRSHGSGVSLEPTHFYAEFSGQPGLRDAPPESPFIIELDLALQRDELIGAATFTPLSGIDGDQLPHFVKLARLR
jgi:CubicO group peptidase (beta-lactamase class C family)